MTDTAILCIIVGKFSHKDELDPIFSDKSLEISFHSIISPFSLAIHLWMKVDWDLSRDFKEIAYW